jgi:hypothetical protein
LLQLFCMGTAGNDGVHKTDDTNREQSAFNFREV